jgi:hypothetical protein
VKHSGEGERASADILSLARQACDASREIVGCGHDKSNSAVVKQLAALDSCCAGSKIREPLAVGSSGDALVQDVVVESSEDALARSPHRERQTTSEEHLKNRKRVEIVVHPAHPLKGQRHLTRGGDCSSGGGGIIVVSDRVDVHSEVSWLVAHDKRCSLVGGWFDWPPWWVGGWVVLSIVLRGCVVATAVLTSTTKSVG